MKTPLVGYDMGKSDGRIGWQIVKELKM